MPTPRTLMRTRYSVIAIHLLVIVVFFILAFLHDTFLWLIAVICGVPFVVYVPAALWYGRERSTRVYDRAGAEVAYLSIQMALWMSIIVLGLHYAGPNACARLTYEIGKAQGSQPELSMGPGLVNAVLTTCDLDTALNVLSCLHFVLLAAWTWYIVYRVRRIPVAHNVAFKYGVTKILRGEYEAREALSKGDVEMGSMTRSEQDSRTGVSTGISTLLSTQTGGGARSRELEEMADRPIPPALPPRPQTDRSLQPVDTVPDIPPPAYEPTTTLGTSPITTTATAASAAVSPDTPSTLTIAGRPIDFDSFMRIQQQKIEEKMALERENRSGTRIPSPGDQERSHPLASSGWGAGPSTSRRRRSA